MKRLVLVNAVVAGLVALLLGGCATYGKGLSDEEQIDALVKECVAEAQAQDLDAMFEFYSEDFDHYEFGDKAGMRDYIENIKAMGYLDDVEIVCEEAAIEIDGDTAVIYPIDMEGSFGSAVIEITATKEDGTWKVTSMDIAF